MFLSPKGGVEKEIIELSSYSDSNNPSKIAILIYLGQQCLFLANATVNRGFFVARIPEGVFWVLPG
jgi:hypothetical protein